MEIIGLIIAGLIVGALGRLFHPGRDPIGLLLTLAIGIAAVLVTGLILPFDSFILDLIVAVIVGVVLVALVSRFMAGRARTA